MSKMGSFVGFLLSLPWVVQGLFQHDSTTRAASVELWVVVPAVLVLIQFAIGIMGPRFVIARKINPGLQILRILSFYSVNYTLGLMKPSISEQSPDSSANEFFQIWAVLIVAMQDSARIGRPYRPQEMSLVDLLTSLWSANQLRSSTVLYLKVPLWVIWCIHASRIILYYFSSNGAAAASDDNMKLVSDYMALSQNTGVAGNADNTGSADDPNNTNNTDNTGNASQSQNTAGNTMARYKYLVVGEDLQVKTVEKPTFRFELKVTRPEELITVDKVWAWSGDSPSDRLLGRQTDSDSKFKDVCLSFALYKLLRRRFYGFSLPEAKEDDSSRLVSHTILDCRNDPNYDRVFRITEVELSFLQDFAYSKHAVVFARGFPLLRVVVSSCMTAAALYLAYAVREIPSKSLALVRHRRLARITHGVFVTHFLIIIVVCRELLEILVFVMSQWTKVLVVCHYITLKLKGSKGWASGLHLRTVELVARIMFRIISRGQWDQKIQQHNLLMAARIRTPNRRIRLRFVKLRTKVKKNIFESLKALIISASTPSPEENNASSESSIQERKNAALLTYLGAAFPEDPNSEGPPIQSFHGKLQGDTHKILAWHVATSLCQIALLEEDGRQVNLYTLPEASMGDDAAGLADLWSQYNTAVTLSNYCVHLVALSLLPDNGLVANKVFKAVREEARDDLRGSRTWKETRDRLAADAWTPDRTPDGTSIVKIGAQLATELLSRYGREDLWNRLGKFWTGYLFYLSASTKASKHQIHLQGRGELTTHIWALLSHAGFLGVNTAHGQQLLDPFDLNSA